MGDMHKCTDSEVERMLFIDPTTFPGSTQVNNPDDVTFHFPSFGALHCGVGFLLEPDIAYLLPVFFVALSLRIVCSFIS